MNPAVCTVVTRSYLPYASNLMSSVEATHGDSVARYVVVVDELDACPSEGERFTRLGFSELGAVSERDVRFRYDWQQLVIACKPGVMRALMDRGHDVAIFLDADIVAYDSLGEMLDPPEQSDILLLPHLLEPRHGPRASRLELRVLVSGTINGGGIAVRDTPNGRAFLGWFEQRLLVHCVRDVERGAHFDQRWLDLAMCYFDGVWISRDPRLNVAYWNLPERAIIEGAAIRPRFFHFSGHEPTSADTVTRYYDDVSMDDLGIPRTYFPAYVEGLRNHGLGLSVEGYRWGCLSDGTRILPELRSMWALLDADVRSRVDPFDSMAIREIARTAIDSEHDIPTIWRGVHAMRPDLQLAFAAPSGADAARFKEWVASYGEREHPAVSKFVSLQSEGTAPGPG